MNSEPGSVRAALQQLNQHGDVKHKSLFYHALVSGEVYLGVTRTEQRSGEQTLMAVDVMAATGPDGYPVVLAFSELPSGEEQIPGIQYVKKSGLDVLQLVVDGGFGGVIIDPQGPWAGVPRQDAANLLLNLAPPESQP